MTPAKKLFLLLLGLSVGQVLVAQTTYNSIANGDWNASTTWDAAGIPPATIPAGDVVNLNHRVTLQSPNIVTNNGSVLVPNEGSAVSSTLAAGLTVDFGATFNNNNDLIVGPYTATVTNLVIQARGSMNNSGNIIVNSPPTGGSGRVRYSNSLNNLPGGLVEIYDVASFTEVFNAQGATIRQFDGFVQGSIFGGTFTNEGLLDILGSSFIVRNGAVIINNPTGVINNGGFMNVGFANGTITNLGTINNTNSLGARSSSGTGVITSTNGTINNDGVIFETGDSELNFSATTLSGSGGVFGGQFSSALSNSTPGTTTINGPLINSGKVLVRINGTTSEDFSVIEVLGTANLTGTTLEGFIPNSYLPSIGDEFEILTATGGVTGTFSATELTDIGPDLDWEVTYEANRAVLKVIEAGGGGGGGGGGGNPGDLTSVPTMSQWGLIIFALLILTLSTITAMQKEVTAEGTQSGSFSIKHFPFEKSSFIFWLVGTALTLMLVFTVAIVFAGYELTNADLPGSILAIPIAAYLLHLLFGYKK